jgi:glycerol kinase
MQGDLSWLVGELRALAGDLDSEAQRLPLVLAIDQGGHASRVIAFDAHGKQYAESFAPISTFRSGHDRVEHDATEVLESIRTALGDVAQALGEDAQRVVAAGLATQRSSIVCWDSRTGQPLSPVLSWQDRRTAKFIDSLHQHETLVHETTGLVLSPHYGASKLKWCLENIEKVSRARASQRLLAGPLAAFLMFSLLSERPRVVDPANASRTLLWNVHTGTWSVQLTKLFDLPVEVLPECVPSRYAFGHLQFASRNVPLVVCTGDQSAMPFATGQMDPEAVYLNIGTGAFLQRVMHGASPSADRLLHSVLWSDERGQVQVQEGTVNAAGAALDWLNERVGIDTHRAALAMTRHTASADVPIFINALSGVGSPFWLPRADSRFIGEGSEVALVQAVIESVAFLICTNLETMRAAQAIHRVVASGGLSACEYLCDCIAALAGLPVDRLTLREATATGLAYLVLGTPAEWHGGAETQRFEPNLFPNLSQRFQQWQTEMAQLSPK